MRVLRRVDLPKPVKVPAGRGKGARGFHIGCYLAGDIGHIAALDTVSCAAARGVPKIIGIG